MVQPQIDQILAWASKAVDDIVEAKKEYFANTGGEVHEDDRCFEQRMQAFFNWYLFDRKRGSDTPVQQFLQEKGPSLTVHDKDVMLGFVHSKLGLYEYRGTRGIIRRPKQGQVRVKDAVTGEKFNVTERRQMHGLEIGDLFEARLVPVHGTYHFSSSFTYHPRDVKRAILREVKRRRKQGPVDVRALVWELEKMSLQAERFKNVNIENIYNFEHPFLGARRPAAAEQRAEPAAGQQRRGTP